MQTHYSTLNIPEDADSVTIRLAYRRLLRHWHPDRNGDAQAAAITQRLTAAHRVLSNVHERGAYDQLLATERARLAAAANPRPVRARRPGTHDTPKFSGSSLRVPEGLLNKAPWQSILSALRRLGRARE